MGLRTLLKAEKAAIFLLRLQEQLGTQYITWHQIYLGGVMHEKITDFLSSIRFIFAGLGLIFLVMMWSGLLKPSVPPCQPRQINFGEQTHV